MSRRLLEGRPSPMGANWDGHGVNFALFSANAEKVELCLFDATGKHEIERLELPCVSDQVWHGYLPDCAPGSIYGYRVYGPYQPQLGQRFNHHKLLLDPYAKSVIGSLHWCAAVYGFEGEDALSEHSFETSDSAEYVPKAVIVDETFDWEDDCAPRIPWSQTIIYETHVGGFTRLHPLVDETLRGKFSALATPVVIDYLTSLGITSIELMPIHAFVDDFFLVDKNLSNYWGYNTLGYFAPAPRYLVNGERNEFKTMVKQLHRAGIEVILDVVYNHTAEGNQDGPTLCFRGIDNASYYRLPEDNARLYVNDSGCGNTLNASHPRVLQMIIDSLRYWVSEMHVDGFRFDLAVSLGREAHGFDSNSYFFKSLRADELLSQVKLIAEPWDIGPGGYQLGAFPPDWAEWNDRFRDTVRRFWRGDPGQIADFARALHGSSELFDLSNRSPAASINLITSHDGFTLADLVSFNQRHNFANGESNQDGHEANFSYNYGSEGESDSAEINFIRRRQRINFVATLLLSQGTPMLLAGDELGHSQQGNNNAYCQDNELTWLNWSLLECDADFRSKVQQLLSLRKACAVFHRDYFIHDQRVQWLRADGGVMQESDWHDPEHRFLAMLLDGSDLVTAQHSATALSKATLILCFNAAATPVSLVLPDSGNSWHSIFTSTCAQVTDHAITSAVIDAQSLQLFESRAQSI